MSEAFRLLACLLKQHVGAQRGKCLQSGIAVQLLQLLKQVAPVHFAECQTETGKASCIQCALVHHWDPGPLLDVLALDDEARAQGRRALSGVADGVPAPSPAVVDALHRRLDAVTG